MIGDMRQSALFASVALLLMSGCGASTKPADPPKVTTNPAAEKSAPEQESATVGVPVDGSLTTEAYVKLGLPSPDRTWTSSELAKAAKVLAELSERDASQLPRAGSAKSGKVFSRITSEDNLKVLKSKLVPLPVRVGFALQFLQASGSLSKTYSAALAQDQVSGDESTEVLGQNLRVGVEISSLSKEVLASLDKEDKTFEVRPGALKQVKSALGPITQKMIAQAVESKKLTPEHREKALVYIDRYLPEILRTLPPEIRQEAVAKLKGLSEKPEFAGQEKLIHSILDKLSQATEDAAANDSKQ
jgi:hypothetical protein